MTVSNKLAVTVHHNNEVTIKDERGYPAVCRDCRFSGWRNDGSYRSHFYPQRCLHYSGGGDPVDGDRIMEGLRVEWNADQKNWDGGCYDKLYPRCARKNKDGDCQAFALARKYLAQAAQA